jgi:hypothetical protein
MQINYEKTKRGVVLEEQVMLATVRVSVYPTVKRDKKASVELADSKNASRKKTRVNKGVLGDAFPETSAIAARIRSVHYRFTGELPSDGNGQAKGPRLLPARLAEQYLDQVTDLIDMFGHSADAECAAIEKWRERERISLGELFREDDYPTPEECRDRFSANVFVDGLPTVKSLSAGIHTATVQAQANDRQGQIISTLATQLMARMVEHVSHLANELGKESSRIHDSLFGNVRELATDLIPAFNVMGDQNLIDFGKDIEDKLLKYTDDQVRNTPTVRPVLASEAARLAKSIAQYAKTQGMTKADLPKPVQVKAAAYF